MTRSIRRSLAGMVGMERFEEMLAIHLFDFVSGSESRARIFWGDPSCGKTELAQRIAGLRSGYPALSAGLGNVHYVSGVDGKLEVKSIVDALPEKSILLIDESDKCLDPAVGMVTAAEAIQLHHSIVTHFSRKPLYWVFIGTFSAMRSGKSMNFGSLENALGKELASRVDFVDWEFPRWTIQNLLLAVKPHLNRRGLAYEDQAVPLLAEYCISIGGGVRAFDTLDQTFSRNVKRNPAPNQQLQMVTLGAAQELLARLGYRRAA